MCYRDILDITANWAAILTAVIATIAYGRFLGVQLKHQKVLEDYLRNERLGGYDEGRRTILHLMSYLKMTEAEVLRAGFRSKKIRSSPGEDERGRADCIFFEYDGNDVPVRRPL